MFVLFLTCAHQGYFPRSQKALHCRAAGGESRGLWHLGGRTSGTGTKLCPPVGRKASVQEWSPLLGDFFSGRLGRCRGEQEVGMPGDFSLRKASEVRGGQGIGMPGQAIREAEACQGPSLLRTLLTLQLTAKQDVGQGPVYTAVHTVSVCGVHQSCLDRSQVRSGHLLLRNIYHYLCPEQSHRNTHMSVICSFCSCSPAKPPGSPSQPLSRPLAPFAGPSTLNQFLCSPLTASALLLQSFMLPRLPKSSSSIVGTPQRRHSHFAL